MSLKFSMLLEAIDRVTAPAKRIQNSMKGIGRGAREMARDVGRVGREASQITRLDRLSRSLAAGIGAAGRAAKRWAGRLGIGSIGDAAEKAGFGVGRLIKKMGGLALTAAKWAGGAAIAGGGFALFDMFGTASKFEQFQIMLENTEGSAEKARRAMGWVKQFAQTTPYELDQVMEAFVSLKAYGIDPMNGSLMALGDGAAGMSKPVMQAVEALADAVTGEFERLKEFGIRSSKIGDQVAFTYMRNGKEVRRQVKMNAVEVEKAITGIMRDRFGGMMIRQSQTFSGMISNLKDAWSGFQMMVADAGIFDKVKGKLEQWLGKVNEMAKDGRLQAWAEKLSDKLETAFDWAVRFVEETDWNGVANTMQRIADALVIAANAVLTIASHVDTINSVLNFNGWLLDKARDAQAQRQSGVNAPKVNWPTAPARPSPLLTGGGTRGAQAATQVGGKISLEVTTSPGTKARVRSMQSDNRNVPLFVQLGQSMGGPK